jgi:hypothetical protein
MRSCARPCDNVSCEGGGKCAFAMSPCRRVTSKHLDPGRCRLPNHGRAVHLGATSNVKKQGDVQDDPPPRLAFRRCRHASQPQPCPCRGKPDHPHRCPYRPQRPQLCVEWSWFSNGHAASGGRLHGDPPRQFSASWSPPRPTSRAGAPSVPSELAEHTLIVGPAGRSSEAWSFRKGGKATSVRVQGRFGCRCKPATRRNDHPKQT